MTEAARARVFPHRWACLTRDLKIYERPHELEAYKRAQVNVFLLPGEATAAELAQIVATCLSEICAVATNRDPQSWTKNGLEPYLVPKRDRRTK